MYIKMKLFVLKCLLALTAFPAAQAALIRSIADIDPVIAAECLNAVLVKRYSDYKYYHPMTDLISSLVTHVNADNIFAMMMNQFPMRGLATGQQLFLLYGFTEGMVHKPLREHWLGLSLHLTESMPSHNAALEYELLLSKEDLAIIHYTAATLSGRLHQVDIPNLPTISGLGRSAVEYGKDCAMTCSAIKAVLSDERLADLFLDNAARFLETSDLSSPRVHNYIQTALDIVTTMVMSARYNEERLKRFHRSLDIAEGEVA